MVCFAGIGFHLGNIGLGRSIGLPLSIQEPHLTQDRGITILDVILEMTAFGWHVYDR